MKSHNYFQSYLLGGILPLWKIWVKVSFPNWMESHKIPWFQTTNQIFSILWFSNQIPTISYHSPHVGEFAPFFSQGKSPKISPWRVVQVESPQGFWPRLTPRIFADLKIHVWWHLSGYPLFRSYPCHRLKSPRSCEEGLSKGPFQKWLPAKDPGFTGFTETKRLTFYCKILNHDYKLHKQN